MNENLINYKVRCEHRIKMLKHRIKTANKHNKLRASSYWDKCIEDDTQHLNELSEVVNLINKAI